MVIEFKYHPVLKWYHQKPGRSETTCRVLLFHKPKAEDKRAASKSSYVRTGVLLYGAVLSSVADIYIQTMKNIKQLIRKLQTALNMREVPVIIEEKTFWSIKYKRIMTKYTVKIRWPDRKADKVIETYSAAEVAKALAAELRKTETP